jgi:thiol-disulfide isomerase/thioredoxin
MRLTRHPANAGILTTGLVAAALAASSLAAARADEGTTKPERAPVAIGKELPDFETKDLQGKPFRLSTARTIDAAAAFAAVAAAAKAHGAKEPQREDALESIEGLKDPEERAAALQVAATEYGLIVGAEAAAGWKTLGDVADWISASAEAPIVLLVWSPKCPTSRAYEPRILEIAGATGARLYPLASNGKGETDEEAKAFLEAQGLPYRVLLDREQVVCDRLGGTKTPHAFVIDKQNRLRYAGAIDDDPMMEQEDAAARRNYLREAIERLKAGGVPDVWMTAPKG